MFSLQQQKWALESNHNLLGCGASAKYPFLPVFLKKQKPALAVVKHQNEYDTLFSHMTVD